MTKRIPQLDAVRGIAIVVVVLHNSLYKFPSLPGQSLFAYGWMGVDLFFVLSGFLITGILLDTKRSRDYFRNFYVRRALRILPLYYLVLAFMFVAMPLVRPSEGSAIFARSSPWWAYPFFLQNFLVHDSTGAAGPLGVTWSVAIEEQFYVVWALAVRFCSCRGLRNVAATVICLSPLLRLYLSLHNVDLYSNLFCRLDGLMAGGLLAVASRSADFRPDRLLTMAWLVLVLAVPSAFLSEALRARWLTFSVSSLASAAFVFLALFERRRWFQALLASRYLVYTGTISYGLYLLHKIPSDVAERFSRQHQLPGFLAGLAASFLMAMLSWKLLEQPVMRWKRLF